MKFLLCLIFAIIPALRVAAAQPRVVGVEVIQANGGTGTNLTVRGMTMPNLTANRPMILNGSGNPTNAVGTPDGTKFLRDDGTLAVPAISIVTNFLFFSTNFYVQNSVVSNYFTTNVFHDTYASNYFVTNLYQFSSTTNFYMSNIINNDTYISNFYLTNILVDNTYVSNYYTTNLFLSTNLFVTNLFVTSISTNPNQFGASVTLTLKDGAQLTNLTARGLTLPTLTASRPAILNASGNLTNATGTPDGTKFLRDDGTLAVPAISITTNFLFFSTNFYIQNTTVSNYFQTNVFNDTYASNYFVTNIYQFATTTNFYMSNIINNDTYISNFYLTNILVDNTYVSNYYTTNLFLSTNLYYTNLFLTSIATNANQFGPSVTLTLKNGVMETNVAAYGLTNFGTAPIQSDAGLNTGDGTTYGMVGFLDASTAKYLVETWTNVTFNITNVYDTPWPVGIGWCYQIASSNGFLVKWTNGPCVNTNATVVQVITNLFVDNITIQKGGTFVGTQFVNITVVTNLYGSTTFIASNAASFQLDFTPGVGTTHYQMTNMANAFTIQLTNLYTDTYGPRDAWFYFETDGTARTVTVSTNGLTTGTRISWGFNSITNGATSFTVTNRARLNLVRNRAGVISAAYEFQQ